MHPHIEQEKNDSAWWNLWWPSTGLSLWTFTIATGYASSQSRPFCKALPPSSSSLCSVQIFLHTEQDRRQAVFLSRPSERPQQRFCCVRIRKSPGKSYIHVYSILWYYTHCMLHTRQIESAQSSTSFPVFPLDQLYIRCRSVRHTGKAHCKKTLSATRVQCGNPDVWLTEQNHTVCFFVTQRTALGSAHRLRPPCICVTQEQLLTCLLDEGVFGLGLNHRGQEP